MLTFAVRSWTPTLFVAILAIAALVPMGTQGHSGEEANHHAAVMALVLHIIAAAIWLGGLLLMVVVRPLIGREAIATAMSRYSSIALAAFVVVAISGTVRAAIAVGAWENLASPYGAILLVKVACPARARRARRLVPQAADRRMGEDAGIPPLLGLVALGAGVHGHRQRSGCGPRPHGAAHDIQPARGAHAGRDPDRRRACRPN